MTRSRLGVSYAISAVIMTAAIVTLVFITSVFTYQVLDQQRGSAEFQVAEKSILAFDDALENIAWKPQSTRSTRFTVNYGQLELIRNIPLVVNVTGYAGASRSLTTGMVRYSTQTRYINFGANYSAYILGNGQLISNGTESYGRALLEQSSEWVMVTLFYGVRAMKTSTINVTEGIVSYVDIWIIKIEMAGEQIHIGEFDLKATCLGVVTSPTSVYPIADRNININVELGDNDTSQLLIQLDSSANGVVFNFIEATVRVTV